MFGRIPWAELFTPTIKILKDGFAVSGHLANAIQDKKEIILADSNLRLVFVCQVQIEFNDRVRYRIT